MLFNVPQTKIKFTVFVELTAIPLLQNNHHPYTQFRAVPNARYVTEMWFDKITKQTWRN